MASPGIGQKLRVHLLVLPRPFALPVALSSIALGGLLSGVGGGNLALALLTGIFLLAFAHSTNSWLDWLIGFDRGPKDERSRKKLYTGAQNVIAEGKVSFLEVAFSAQGWLMLALVGAVALNFRATPWVWLPFFGIIGCAYAYSFAKKAWCPELPLGLGFGPLAVVLGATASPDPDLWRAFLAGIPLGIMFGGAAELVDQWLDAEVNIDKGLRSLGVIAWVYNVLPELLTLEVVAAYVALGVVVVVGILSPWSFLSVLAVPLLAYTIARVTTQTGQAIRAGLLGVFLVGALITLGQAIGG